MLHVYFSVGRLELKEDVLNGILRHLLNLEPKIASLVPGATTIEATQRFKNRAKEKMRTLTQYSASRMDAKVRSII